MTDKDTVKALECCVNGRCSACPAKAMFCSEKAPMAFALDLINRQKAEIEEKNELIERLQNTNVRALRGTAETVKANARAEAIKEFASRLKNMLTACSYTLDGEREYLIRDYDVDNLVKEMVGDE